MQFTVAKWPFPYTAMFQRRSSEAIPDLFWSGEDLLCWPERDTPWDAFPPLMVSMATDPNSTVTLTVAPQQYLRVVTPEEVASLGLVGDNCYKFAVSVSDTGMYYCVNIDTDKLF